MDTDGETPLAPNHLLRVNESVGLPPIRTDEDDSYVRRGWRHVQYLVDRYWKRFARDYLGTVIARPKWFHKECNLAVGDIVIVAESSLVRSQWPLGSVANVLPDEHGVVQTVVVKMKGREYKRPIHKLSIIQRANVSI